VTFLSSCIPDYVHGNIIRSLAPRNGVVPNEPPRKELGGEALLLQHRVEQGVIADEIDLFSDISMVYVVSTAYMPRHSIVT
jgi:hypothetical protein